ncbi:MAG TPA: hypothetical protein VF147_17385 [Vicinamibacterales bacterium]
MRTAAIALAILLTATTAAAQRNSRQRSAVRDHATVFIVAANERCTGRLLTMDVTTITIQPHDGPPRTWSLTDVTSVETDKWDSPYDGAAAGAIAMAVYSLFAGLTIAAEAPNKGSVFLTLTATGAFAGYAIDAAHKSKVTVSLYERSPASASAAGLFVTMRF